MNGSSTTIKISLPHRTFYWGLGLASLVLILDQLSKWWIVSVVMQPPKIIPLTSFFNLVLGWNRGISFGLFHGDSAFNAWGLPAIALVITAFLLVWLWRSSGMMISIAIGSIIGGALGNVVDRLRFGAVADFLDFHVFGYHWPAFNLADMGITLGAVLLIYDSLFGGEEINNNKG
ncbi:MAG: signal peptidase II [Rhodospirillaceae bacterium]|jgi:signal peptidase II